MKTKSGTTGTGKNGGSAAPLKGRRVGSVGNRPPSGDRTVTGTDGRRYLDLTPAQLTQALAGARPRSMSRINSVAAQWARSRGYAGSVDWSIDDLALAGLVVRTVGGRRIRYRNGRPGRVGAFRWVLPNGRLGP